MSESDFKKTLRVPEIPEPQTGKKTLSDPPISNTTTGRNTLSDPPFSNKVTGRNTLKANLDLSKLYNAFAKHRLGLKYSYDDKSDKIIISHSGMTDLSYPRADLFDALYELMDQDDRRQATLVILGVLLIFGVGVESTAENERKGVRYLIYSAEEYSDESAIYQLNEFGKQNYSHGNFETAFNFVKPGLECGDDESIYIAAWCCLSGNKNLNAWALNQLIYLSDKGYSVAACMAAWVYEHGDIVFNIPRDLEKANFYYELAYQLGNEAAGVALDYHKRLGWDKPIHISFPYKTFGETHYFFGGPEILI
jgi:TPR repeat protein